MNGYAEVNGVRLYYEDVGSGRPLIFLNSGLCDLRMWEVQVQAFSRSHRVISYDMREHGKTLPVPGTYRHLDDLAGLMDQLKIETAVLVGCSMGGTLAIDFTLEHPGRVQGLVDVTGDPSGFTFEGDPPPMWDEVAAAFKAGEIEKTARLEAIMWLAGPTRTEADLDPTVLERVSEMNLIALRAEKAEGGEARRVEPPALGRLDQITVPVLAIAGEFDDPEISRSLAFLADKAASGKLVTMAGCAHLPNMENPLKFNDILSEWLQENGF
jgi:pimeloyl-ACP methyl ester carboxylesterase